MPEKIELTDENVSVSGFDNSKLGKNTVTVSYEGHEAKFEVEIVSKQLSKVEITTKPIKTKYIQKQVSTVFLLTKSRTYATITAFCDY